MHPLSILVSALAIITCCHAGKPKDAWEYLDNGVIRIGVDRSRGSAIGYFADSKTQRNPLNHHDEGRFMQQSYYGDKDGTMWAKRTWKYNPVQGGSYKGEDAKTLDFKKTDKSIYAKIEPLHWASAKVCPEALMEEWISLEGPLAKIRMRMEYTGPSHKTKRYQEMPAMFVDYLLLNLVYEKDGQLVRKVPGDLVKSSVQKLQYDTGWMAYVDDQNFGIGICTPDTDSAVSYRFRGAGKTGPTGSSCSYLAPTRDMKLTQGLVVDYHFYLTIGTLDEIRSRFAALRKKP